MNKPFVILMAEDDEHDILATQRAWRKGNIILTTSHEEEDRLKSYDLGANAYVVKPVEFQNLAQAIKTIHLFWELVELPE